LALALAILLNSSDARKRRNFSQYSGNFDLSFPPQEGKGTLISELMAMELASWLVAARKLSYMRSCLAER